MQKAQLLRKLVIPIMAIALITSCQKNSQPLLPPTDAGSERVILPQSAARGSLDYNTFYGPTVEMGNGWIRTWANIKRSNNTPMAIGVEYGVGALDNLSTDPTAFETNTFMLSLHQKVKAITPFDHVMVDWNPEGHEPAGIYTVPHFDIHFYKIPVAEQMMITSLPTAPPAAGYLPASYVINAGPVPNMGTHWLDPSSPELPPTFSAFTYTMIYGSNNGDVIFIEPMITKEFLASGATVNKDYPQPSSYAPSNTYYPSTYNIWEANGRHYVSLSNFVWR